VTARREWKERMGPAKSRVKGLIEWMGRYGDESGSFAGMRRDEKLLIFVRQVFITNAEIKQTQHSLLCIRTKRVKRPNQQES
jgi:hypothetical protein